MLLLLAGMDSFAQAPAGVHSAQIYQQMKRLNVLGSVLYIAAHPDDENTRLLAWLASEKLYRAGYLSLTRGDGGQNLIGNEQGIDLGLIRTQELLAARRTDGAEQFFTSAYDFGYCKSPEEALKTWNHDKILGEVVFVIRKFRPDIIIARFPTTGEGGHGHHTASAILAAEAFDAAGDPNRYPEHFKLGLATWKATRLLWNTFNFGSSNTQREDQFKVDVGQFNPLLGKSYGEIAAISRSQHKSQGFGVPSQRGSINEYFKLIRGTAPRADLMDDVETGWSRVGKPEMVLAIEDMVRQFNLSNPASSLPALRRLLVSVRSMPEGYWRSLKEQEIAGLILSCSGLFVEAVTDRQLPAIGDSLVVNVTVNNRLGGPFTSFRATYMGQTWFTDSLLQNKNQTGKLKVLIPKDAAPSQPFWLERGLRNGSFSVEDPLLTGYPQVEQIVVKAVLMAGDDQLSIDIPVRYKYTDPVKGEEYEPVHIVQPMLINAQPPLVIFRNQDKGVTKPIRMSIQAKLPVRGPVKAFLYDDDSERPLPLADSAFSRMETRVVSFNLNSDMIAPDSRRELGARVESPGLHAKQFHALRKISYDHIPDIFYHFVDKITVLRFDLQTAGREIGYIPGAGDRIPEALEQMGYVVTVLKEADLQMPALRRFDAIVTGVRAYNVHEWLSDKYDALMSYVSEGGVLLAQYNTNSSIGPVKARIAPFPFSIGRARVTDEKAEVTFIKPEHPVLNYPNRITAKDFDGWIQERSIYHAESIDPAYERLLSMHDPGEPAQESSLIVAGYGKGRFIYTGLSLFRQLPAGVPGSFRLLANLLAPVRTM